MLKNHVLSFKDLKARFSIEQVLRYYNLFDTLHLKGKSHRGPCPFCEVKEEIGLTVKPERLIDISSKPLHCEIVLTFLCSVVRGNPTLSDEADEIAFFSLSELPKNISLRQRERVEGFFQNPEETVWRKH